MPEAKVASVLGWIPISAEAAGDKRITPGEMEEMELAAVAAAAPSSPPVMAAMGERSEEEGAAGL